MVNNGGRAFCFIPCWPWLWVDQSGMARPTEPYMSLYDEGEDEDGK